MLVISGSASRKLASRVAKALSCPLVEPERSTFPDGESYLRIDREVKGEHAVIVQSTCRPVNDNYIELFLLLDAAKDLGAKRVTAVVPYLGYARQDKRFKPGEAVSVRTMCKLIERAGADDLLTVDIHEEEIMTNFAIPAYNLTAMPLLGRHLSKLELRDPVVLAPDQGALRHARRAAAEFMADHDYLEKTRLTSTKVKVGPKRLDVARRDVVIVDDIISTGGTVIEAIRILKRQGARRIYAACTHPVLVGDAMRRILAAGAKAIIATDTIEHKTSVVSVAPVIAEAIRQGSP
ncbi:MAG: ribose-phosphate diphosphokinase [Hadesarchaea archaeon]|nr:ribose-phosphate diphosphokinase [Hadesarchaea archaeon]